MHPPKIQSRRSANASSLILFHKPYGFLSQFTDEGRWKGLATFGFPKGYYTAGRLDADSEGLLILTNNGQLAHKLTDPSHAHPRTYWAQIEGSPHQTTSNACPVVSKSKTTIPARAPSLSWTLNLSCPTEIPPIGFRKSIPTTWIELTLTEGKNRQVRRMTAHIGFPTLRLIRVRIGAWTLSPLAPGEWVYSQPQTN